MRGISHPITRVRNSPTPIKSNGNDVPAAAATTGKPNNFDEKKSLTVDNKNDELIAPESENSENTPFANSTPKLNNKHIPTANHLNNDESVTNETPLNLIGVHQSLDMSSIDRSAESNCATDNEINQIESKHNGIEEVNANGETAVVQSNNDSNDVTNEPESSSSKSVPETNADNKKSASKKTAARNKNKNGGKSNKRNNSKNLNKKMLNNKFVERTEKSDIKRETAALAKFRGPYVHIERNGSQVVINTPLTEETAEKQSKFKKSFISQTATDRNRIRGLHVSTLSNKYDAVTTDISWMCVFCKLGPHKYGLGDLFGPFILSTESEEFQLTRGESHEDLSRKLRTKAAQSKAGRSSLKSPVADTSTSAKKKRKLSQLNDSTTENGSTSQDNSSQELTNGIDIFYGMTKASEHAYEVWVHEDCVVWSSGVHIIGARVVGLEAAVWDSVRHQCVICKHFGAVLSCLKRNCKEVVHAPCAKRNNWLLNERTFQSHCPLHGHNELNHIESYDDSHKQNN